MPNTKIGGRDTLIDLEGNEHEVIVLRVKQCEEGTYILHRYPNLFDREYETFFPAGKDTSGIEKYSGMPVAYRDKTMSDFRWDFYAQDISEQRRYIELFRTNFRQCLEDSVGLYLYSGTKGSGKTLLACCLANEIIKKHGLQVKFIGITDYIAAVKEKAHRRFLEASVLVIDDMGMQGDKTEWVDEVVFSLVNYRYTQRKLTLFTANMRIMECSKNDRVVSRIEEMATEVHIPEVAVRSKLAHAKMRQFWNGLEERWKA